MKVYTPTSANDDEEIEILYVIEAVMELYKT